MADIVSSLTQEDIPIKLRCASCNKLVLDAYRLPCCDQNICGTCQAALPETCLVCSHSPISAADCKPNKALRLTIKAFLKSEEKKREKERGAAAAASVPQTPITPATPLELQAESKSQAEVEQDGVDASKALNQAPDDNEKQEDKTIAVEDDLSSRPEPDQEKNVETEQGDAVDDPRTDEGSGNASGPQQHWNGAQTGGQFAPSNNQMPNQMGWGQMNNFNPMMQMQMQNGMGNGNWGFPNMMGLGMNPMDMSHNMYGGFGMQHMNGLNNMNGMMGGGMGFNSDYGWNNGQFMGNQFGGGHMNGYNQGNQGPFPQVAQNNYQNQNGARAGVASRRPLHRAAQSQSRIGRPDAQQNGDRSASARAEDAPIISQEGGPDTNGQPDASGAISTTGEEGNTAEEVTADANSRDAVMNDESAAAASGLEQTMEPAEDDQGAGSQYQVQNVANYDDSSSNANAQRYTQDQYDGSGYMPNLPVPQQGINHNMMQNNYYADDQQYPVPMGPGMSFGFPGRGGGGRGGRGRGGWRGRGGFGSYNAFEQPGPMPMGQGVEGAPTGPKAMREGHANRGNFRGRGNSGVMPLRDQSLASESPLTASGQPAEESEQRQLDVESRGRTPSYSKSRSRSRSVSRHSGSRRRSRTPSTSHVNDRNRGYGDDHDRDSRVDHVDDYDDQAEDRFSRASSIQQRSSRDEKPRDRNRSTRSRRHSSRDRSRHKHRSRSRDSQRESFDEYDKGHHSSKTTSESGRRKSHSDRHRERSERDREYGGGRSRDDDRDRRRDRRNRSPSESKDVSHKSSRRRRRDRDRRRDRADSHDRRKSITTSHQTRHSRFDGEGEVELKIQGQAMERRASRAESRVIESPTTRAPPTGPRALLTKISTMHPPSSTASGRRSQLPTPSASESAAPTPRTPPVDPHTLEREARNRERMLKEEQRRSQLNGGGAGAAKIERKRSYAAEDDHYDDQRRHNDDDGDDRFRAGLEPPSGPRGERDRRKRSRRGSLRHEQEDDSTSRRGERDRARWR